VQMRTGRTVIATAVMALVSLLAMAALSSANGVVSGKTKLKPDSDTFEALADMSIAVETTGKAEFKPSGAKFPVSGGDIDPTAGFQGIYGHRGGLMFSRSDGAAIKFKHLTIEIEQNKAKLFASASGSELKLAALKNGQIAGTDTSFQLKDAEAELAKQGAEALSETFDFDFHKGIPLGTVTTKATVTEGQVEE
jgi:hypothetical protein